MNLVKGIETIMGDGDCNHYVYALCDQSNIPFYIGKGRGARLFAHEKEADIISVEMENADEERKIEITAHLKPKIRAILSKKGGAIKRVIIKWGLTSYEALMCESAVINMLKFCKNVRLDELTNIANGHATDAEKSSNAETKTKARTVEEFVRECAMEELPLEDISTVLKSKKGDKKQSIALINIHKLFNKCFDHHSDKVDVAKVGEVVRGVWRISKENANHIKYLFAMYRQKIVGIYGVEKAIQLNDKKLRKFPSFPKDVRRNDKLIASKANFAELQRDIGSSKEILNNVLGKPQKGQTYEKRFLNMKKRWYFIVKDDVPAEIMRYHNCYPTIDGRAVFEKGGRALNPVRVY